MGGSWNRRGVTGLEEKLTGLLCLAAIDSFGRSGKIRNEVRQERSGGLARGWKTAFWTGVGRAGVGRRKTRQNSRPLLAVWMSWLLEYASSAGTRSSTK